MRRFFWSIREAYEVLFVYALNIMVWSGFAYVLFYGKKLKIKGRYGRLF